MKRLTKLFLVLCIIGLGTAEASFPVKKGNNTEAVTEDSTAPKANGEEMDSFTISDQEVLDRAEDIIDSTEKTSKFSEEDWILLALWFFLGGFAAHRWYAGRPVGWNILFILTLGGCGIWALIDLVKILQRDFM